ncbi:MAG: helix-turn-helix transcriptional regulator [Bacilli bacterium]
MSIGENIRNQRFAKNLTQKELGDKLFVTSQAISRWEQNLVEPSIQTIKKMASIFEISVDQLLGQEDKAEVKEEIKEEKKEEVTAASITSDDVKKEINDALSQYKRQIGVCDDCHKPILEGEEVHAFPETRGVRNHVIKEAHMLCGSCFVKEEEKKRRMEHFKLVSTKKNAFKWSIITGIIVLIITIIAACFGKEPGIIVADVLVGLLMTYILFSLVFICIADNTKVGDLFLNVIELGFVKMPGIIFSLSFDGFIFLIAAKIVLWIISVLLMIAGLCLGILVCGIPAAIMFPISLKRLDKSIKDTKSSPSINVV